MYFVSGKNIRNGEVVFIQRAEVFSSAVKTAVSFV